MCWCSILPRKSGASDEPMPAGQAVSFTAPASMAVTIELPNRGPVRGMGLQEGVTLVVGGGQRLWLALCAGAVPGLWLCALLVGSLQAMAY